MSIQNPDPSIDKVRYSRRAKDSAWARAYLHKAPFGMLATEFEGQPFLKPSLYVYDEAKDAIYLHGALEGRMRTNIETNQRVCFCVAEMGRLVPADTAMDFGVEYASVVVFGEVKIVIEEKEAREGLQLLMDRYFPHLKAGEDYREIIPQELDITAVYRIDIRAISGKETQKPVDIAGAFTFPYDGK
jgi:nitroimidazol reductase NimA-like FMN-containing flavoprotein (pyridoxamine 5'-phosphate oxidase superfamily)